MKETGIIMSGNHPKLILDGIKTIARRVIKPQLEQSTNAECDIKWGFQYYHKNHLGEMIAKCPYGQVGDRLWVRETQWRGGGYVATDKPYIEHCGKIPSIFMPRWASRITLEITGLRVERVQEITEGDAKAEGTNGYTINKFSYGEYYRVFREYHREFYPLVDHGDIGDIVRFQGPNMGFACFQSKNPKCKGGTLNIDAKESFKYVGALECNYKNGFHILWDSLNAKRGYSWDKNPWVWVISFKKLEGG